MRTETPYKITSSRIPFMTGRPLRDTCILKDEITDLKILLNITYDVNDFIAMMQNP